MLREFEGMTHKPIHFNPSRMTIPSPATHPATQQPCCTHQYQTGFWNPWCPDWRAQIDGNIEERQGWLIKNSFFFFFPHLKQKDPYGSSHRFLSAVWLGNDFWASRTIIWGSLNMLDVLFSSFFICIILEPTEMQQRATRSAVCFLSGMQESVLCGKMLHGSHASMWWFPNIGMPPKIIHFSRIFPYKPSSYWGTSISGNPPFLPHIELVGTGQNPGDRPCSLYFPL